MKKLEIMMPEIELHKGKRSGIDFSSHEVYEVKRGDSITYTLKIPNRSKYHRINFINIEGIMVVTGDFGNWMFNREFHPGDENFVSDGYWHEKLGYASTQEGKEFDYEGTEQEIREGLDGGLEEYGYSGDDLQFMKDYYSELLNYVEHSEEEYKSYAYNEMPSFMDAEDIPYVTKTKAWLNTVFDAFDEMCERKRQGWSFRTIDKCEHPDYEL
jgi:hypothetical protein